MMHGEGPPHPSKAKKLAVPTDADMDVHVDQARM